jgi:phosphatidylcholine synthase
MRTSLLRTWAAWGVHLYTAIGAPLGLLALEASSRHAFGSAFLWMTLAIFIDSTDGALARRVGVKQVLPHFDGARLDDIVDYLNYVVVPMVLAYQAGLIPAGLPGLAVASAPLVASGYGFCQLEAKTADHFFTGFPSYWNIVVFYLYALQSAMWFNVTALLAFSVLVFVPIRYLYPSRSTVARRLTYGLGIAWALLMLVLLFQFPDVRNLLSQVGLSAFFVMAFLIESREPSQLLAYISLFFPIYYLAASVHIHRHHARVARS